jgi:hypothetical protein
MPLIARALQERVWRLHYKPMNRWTILGIITALILVAGIVLVVVPGKEAQAPALQITSFEECEAAGYPVMESYPRQCRTPEGALFVEEIETPTTWTTERGNSDILRNISIKQGDTISSPLTITGEARGNWYFEASFPIALTNWDGLIIAEVPATAQGEWMTTEYVRFEATLTFATPTPGDPALNRGTLILQKDNPSGLPEHDDALEIQVVFE